MAVMSTFSLMYGASIVLVVQPRFSTIFPWLVGRTNAASLRFPLSISMSTYLVVKVTISLKNVSKKKILGGNICSSVAINVLVSKRFTCIGLLLFYFLKKDS